jgi:hypothetical protein
MTDKRTVLSAQQVQQLHCYIEQEMRRAGCDHTRRFTFRWAEAGGLDKDDLEDALDTAGGFCDCEVAANVEPDTDLVLPLAEEVVDQENPWLISPKFIAESGKEYGHVILASHDPDNRCHASDGELLIPVPKGCKPHQRMPRFRHFFVGLSSGQPSNLGFITELEAPVSAEEFVDYVAKAELPELSAFRLLEAAYYLSSAQRLKVSDSVSVAFREVTAIAGKRLELNIHKVVLR